MEIDKTAEDAYNMLSKEEKEYIMRVFQNPLNAIAKSTDLERAQCDLCLPEVPPVTELPTHQKVCILEMDDVPSDLLYYNTKANDGIDERVRLALAALSVPIYFGVTFSEAQGRIYSSDTPALRKRKSYCPPQAKCYGCVTYESSPLKFQSIACAWSHFYKDLGFFKRNGKLTDAPLFDFTNLFPYLHLMSGLSQDLSNPDSGTVNCLINMRATIPGGKRESFCPPSYPCISCRVFTWRNFNGKSRYRVACMWNIFLPEKHVCHYSRPCISCVDLQDSILRIGKPQL